MNSLSIFFTLCLLEIVLGIDNVLSFAMLIRGLPQHYRIQGKVWALVGACVLRIFFLCFALSLKHLQTHLSVGGFSFSIEQLFVFFGGLFLLYKSSKELYVQHNSLLRPEIEGASPRPQSLASTIIQIIFVDLVFAIDSVLVAIAFSDSILVIVPSIFVSMLFMYLACDIVIIYTEKSWRMNVLGLIFVMLIGLFLISQSLGIVVDKTVLISVIVFGSLYEVYMLYLDELRAKGK